MDRGHSSVEVSRTLSQQLFQIKFTIHTAQPMKDNVLEIPEQQSINPNCNSIYDSLTGCQRKSNMGQNGKNGRDNLKKDVRRDYQVWRSGTCAPNWVEIVSTRLMSDSSATNVPRPNLTPSSTLVATAAALKELKFQHQFARIIFLERTLTQCIWP